MNASGKIHLTPAKARGKYIIRFIAGQEFANEAQVDNAWQMIQKFADELLRELEQTPEGKMSRRLQRFDAAHAQRYSFVRYVSKDVLDRTST